MRTPPLSELPPGTATATGSWPGSDPVEASRIVIGELGALPHLVELPARGPGADMIGRTAGLLVDLAVEVGASGYRVVARTGRDQRRARDFLRHDVDALEEAVERGGVAPTAVKVQVAGPWTLAAAVQLRTGHRVLTDAGAVAEFAASLAEGLGVHCDEVARRIGAPVLVQVDEPSMPDVLAGSLRTVSGLETIAAVPTPDAEAILRTVLAAAPGATVVHCCASDVPFAVFTGAGADGVGIDVARLRTRDFDGVGELLQEGATVLLGLVPAVDPTTRPTLQHLAAPAVRMVDQLGFARDVLATQVIVTPGCGLAGAGRAWAQRALTLSAELGRAFTDLPTSWTS